ARLCRQLPRRDRILRHLAPARSPARRRRRLASEIRRRLTTQGWGGAMKYALLAAAFIAAAPAFAQTNGAEINSAKSDYRAPRTQTGHPSFEGIWLSQSILELEALPGVPDLVVPEAEAKKVSDRVVDYHANLAFNFLDPEVPELFREA